MAASILPLRNGAVVSARVSKTKRVWGRRFDNHAAHRPPPPTPPRRSLRGSAVRAARRIRLRGVLRPAALRAGSADAAASNASAACGRAACWTKCRARRRCLDRPVAVLVVVTDLRPGFGREVGHDRSFAVVEWDGGAPQMMSVSRMRCSVERSGTVHR